MWTALLSAALTAMVAAQDGPIAAEFDSAYAQFESARAGALQADESTLRSARVAMRAFLRLDPLGESARERCSRAGFCAEVLRDFPQALDLYRSAIQAEPADAWSQTALLRVLVELGRTTEALERAASLATAQSAAVDAFLLAADGRVFDEAARRLRAGQTEVGLFPFERLAALRGAVGDMSNLALSLRLLGRTEAARRHYEAAIAAAPDDALAWNDLGLCLVSAGNIVGALDAFLESVRVDSTEGAGPGLTNLALLARQGMRAAMPDLGEGLRPVMALRPDAQLARWLYLDGLVALRAGRTMTTPPDSSTVSR
ncbi:MAG: tetratricopeptide repeat protein [Planctomycetota bacterium]